MESPVTATAPKPIRSPSYPSSPLGESIGHVRKIETAYRQSQVDRTVAAKVIGYSGLSGPSNQTLAALAQYGLVERAGKGELRVTDRARAILHPNSPEEKRRNLREAAFEPSLFRELRERWPDIIPPEDGVATYLNRLGFNRSAVKPAARAYLQTLGFLEEAGANESHRSGAGYGPESPSFDDEGDISVENATTTETAPGTALALARTPGVGSVSMAQLRNLPPAGWTQAVFPLAEGPVFLNFPEGLTADGYAELKEYLDIFLRRAERATRQQEGSNDEGTNA